MVNDLSIFGGQYKGLNMNTKKIRKLIAQIFRSLKRDFKNMNNEDIFYDVGLMVGYCHSINKIKLSDKIYLKFMGSK